MVVLAALILLWKQTLRAQYDEAGWFIEWQGYGAVVRFDKEGLLWHFLWLRSSTEEVEEVLPTPEPEPREPSRPAPAPVKREVEPPAVSAKPPVNTYTAPPQAEPEKKEEESFLKKMKHWFALAQSYWQQYHKEAKAYLRWLWRCFRYSLKILKPTYLRVDIVGACQSYVDTALLYAKVQNCVLYCPLPKVVALSFTPDYCSPEWRCNGELLYRYSLVQLLLVLIILITTFPLYTTVMLWWHYRRKRKAGDAATATPS